MELTNRKLFSVAMLAIAFAVVPNVIMMMAQVDVARMVAGKILDSVIVVAVGTPILLFILGFWIWPGKAKNIAIMALVFSIVFIGGFRVFDGWTFERIKAPFVLVHDGQVVRTVDDGPIVIRKGQGYEGLQPVEVGKKRLYDAGTVLIPDSDGRFMNSNTAKVVICEVPTTQDYSVFYVSNKERGEDWVQSLVDRFAEQHRKELQSLAEMRMAKQESNLFAKMAIADFERSTKEYFDSELRGTGREFLRIVIRY